MSVRGRRILFLVSGMTEGGAERVASVLCNRWAREGATVTLMPTFSGRGPCLYALDPRVRLDYLADRVGDTSKTLKNQLRRLRALRRAICEVQPDVIIAFLTHVNVAALIAGVGLRMPIIVSERIYPPVQPISAVWLGLARLMYGRAAAVVTQTKGVSEWVKRNCLRARVEVIPNPVEIPVVAGEPFVDPMACVENRRTVLSVGRLVEQKGYDKLIVAFAALADSFRDWDLVILGDGPERERLTELRERFGLGGRVHLPGRVGNVGDWYEKADLFVLSSRYEGFPNALVEAMAYGVPAISTDCPTGPAEIIRNEVDGLLVPLEEGTDGLRRAMRRLMEEEAVRLRFSNRAREVASRFSTDRVGSLWQVLIDAVTSPNK